MFKAISIAFVFIDTYLTIAESSDLPLSSVQEVVPKPEASSIEATKAGNKGIYNTKFREHPIINYILA